MPLLKKCLVALAVSALANGCNYASYLKDPFTDIPAFSKVTENLYRGGVPKAEGYAVLKALGVKTLLDLRNKPAQVERTRREAQAQGFDFVNVPLSIYTWPEDTDVLRVLQTMLSREAQPVYLFCSNGRDRTGAMVAMYRVIVEAKGPKEGYAEALAHGFWPYRGEVVLKKYIHQLKDRKVLYDYAESLL